MRRYPEHPGHKVGGTSREAADAIAARAGTLRRQAYALLRLTPMTADEVAAMVGESVLAMRPRLSELHTAGVIGDSGLRRVNDSGRNAIVWRVNKMPETFTWSYSRLKNFETCPRRHWHYDIAKTIVEPESGPMKEGHDVHKALELRVAIGKPLPLGMTHYEPIMQQLVALPGTKYAEQKLALTAKFKATAFFANDVWFRTVLDFAAIDEPRAGIIDYKTGKVQEDTTQLALMSATIMHHMPTVNRVRAALLFLNQKHMAKAEYTRADLPAIWAKILPRVRKVQQAVEADDFPAKPSGLCKRYCGVTSCEFHGRGSY